MNGPRRSEAGLARPVFGIPGHKASLYQGQRLYSDWLVPQRIGSRESYIRTSISLLEGNQWLASPWARRLSWQVEMGLHQAVAIWNAMGFSSSGIIIERCQSAGRTMFGKSDSRLYTISWSKCKRLNWPKDCVCSFSIVEKRFRTFANDERKKLLTNPLKNDNLEPPAPLVVSGPDSVYVHVSRGWPWSPCMKTRLSPDIRYFATWHLG